MPLGYDWIPSRVQVMLVDGAGGDKPELEDFRMGAAILRFPLTH